MQEILKRLCKNTRVSEETILTAFGSEDAQIIISRKQLRNMQCFVVELGGAKYLIPERDMAYYDKKSGTVTKLQEAFLDYAVLVPLHVGGVDSALKKFRESKAPMVEVEAWMEASLCTYKIAQFYFNHFLNSKALSPFCPIIREAVMAFYLGNAVVATTALIPVFEAGLRNLQCMLVEGSDSEISADEFARKLKKIAKREADLCLAEYDWHPGMYGNGDVELTFCTHANLRSDIVNCFRLFFENVLYKHSSAGESIFSRHVWLHLFNVDTHRPANFYRIFTALTHLTYIESSINKDIPLLGYGDSDAGNKLAVFLELLKERIGSQMSSIGDQVDELFRDDPKFSEIMDRRMSEDNKK